MGVEVERELSRRVGLSPMAGLSGPKKKIPCSAIHVGSSIPRGTMSGAAGLMQLVAASSMLVQSSRLPMN